MIIVTGANGVVGQPLCDLLAVREMSFLRVSRSQRVGHDWLVWDMQHAPDQQALESMAACQTLIHCAPLWHLSKQIDVIKRSNIKRIIAFSSTSVISKQSSPNQKEQLLVKQLQTAESQLQKACQDCKVDLTIFRPSMIYGRGLDQNVTHIAGCIKRFHCFFLAGKGAGLRQPVHSYDLAKACVEVVDNGKTYNKIYTLAGAEVLTYRAMVIRIFQAMSKRPVIISVPVMLLRVCLSLVAKIGNFDYTPEMADRMNTDLAYDNQAAIADFNFSPEGFLAQPTRDLP